MSIATKCTCGYSINGFCTSSIIECKNLIKPMSNNQLPADVQERIKADAEAYIKSYPDEGTEWAAYIAGATAEARHIAPMANALDQIAQAPVPANEREMLSWIETARALCDTTLQQWKGEGESLWQPISTAPKDGSTIEVSFDEEGKETCLARWSEMPVCMIGLPNGTFPPGWATPPEAECDTNLPLDPPLMWREWKGEGKEVGK